VTVLNLVEYHAVSKLIKVEYKSTGFY